jgi:hypothetical protein
MSRAAELLGSLAGREWTDEDGDVRRLELLSPLAEPEIDALAAEWGMPVPQEARAVLRVASGMDESPLDWVDFSGSTEAGVPEELFPRGVPIAGDGYGNYWIVDPRPGADVFGPVFFVCHDPSVVVYQCEDVGTFIEGLLEMMAPPHTGPLDFVHEQAAMEIWNGREAGMPREAALASPDEVLQAFAEPLPPDAWIADMRSPRLGDGFRVLDPAAFVRHSTERLFARRTPRSASVLGRLVSRLFGG